MAETNSVFRTETRDEPLYNHLELFNMPSSSIEVPAENDYRDCRGQQQTGNIGKGRRMFSDYRTESNNEHLYNNIQSINKPSSPATESQAANQTSQDDRGGQQPTVNRKDDRSACVNCYDSCFGLSLPGHSCFIDSIEVGTRKVT